MVRKQPIAKSVDPSAGSVQPGHGSEVTWPVRKLLAPSQDPTYQLLPVDTTCLTAAIGSAIGFVVRGYALALVLCFLLYTLFDMLGAFTDVPRWIIQLGEMLALSLGAVLPAVLVFAGASNIQPPCIAISRSGIRFPPTFLEFGQSRLTRTWSEITAIRQEGQGENDKNAQLIFAFTDGTDYRILLRAISSADREVMEDYHRIYSISGQDQPAGMLPDAHFEQEVGSYTELWERSLSFRSSTFVPLSPGDTICDGKVVVLKQLHCSAMAATYLGKFDDHHLVVIKEAAVPGGSASGVQARDLFRRECLNLTKLDHPAIVKVIDHVVDKDRDYLILQCITGKDLRRYTDENGPASETTALNWLLQISRILEYLHGQTPPLIHRDITPENLMRAADDKIVLIDFGAANHFVQNATGTIIGKHAYIAPEQLYGKAAPKSDLYALGATAYFLLTGHEPTALSETSNIQTVSPDFNQLLARLTKVDINERIQSATELTKLVSELIEKNQKRA